MAATDRPSARSRQETARTKPTEPAEGPRRTATVRLPFVTAEFKAPELHVPRPPAPPSGKEVADAGRVAVSYLPPPERLAYYGGLGALAVLGVIEWPVAAAIGAGTVIAQRTLRERDRSRPAQPASR